MKRRILLSLSAVAFLLSSVRADAAETAGTLEAKRLFDEGVRLMNAADYEHARVKFAAASGIGHSASITWNLAVCELYVGRAARALRHFREYARDKDALPAKLEEAKTTFIPKAQAQVAELRVQAEPGTTIIIDGKDVVGTAPLADDVAVEPGKHVVEASRGGEHHQVAIDVAAKQLLTIDLRAQPSDSQGTQSVIVTPERSATAATSDPAPADEAHGIWPPPLLTVVLGGVAVASGAAGVVFSAHSRDRADAADDLRAQGTRECTSIVGRCAELKEATESNRAAATTATAFYVVSGASLLGAAATWVFFGSKPSRAAWVAPVVSPSVAHVTVGGTF